MVGTAGPGSGAEHERTRSAAGRPRACAADALASRRTGNRGCRVQPAQCRPGQTGRETPGCCSTRAPWRTSTRVPIPSDELTKIDQVLGQLRLGQVSAEGHASRRGEPEENDLDRVPTRRRQMQRSHLPTGRPASCGFLGADPYKRCVSYSPSPPLAGDLGFRRRRVHPAAVDASCGCQLWPSSSCSRKRTTTRVDGGSSSGGRLGALGVHTPSRPIHRHPILLTVKQRRVRRVAGVVGMPYRYRRSGRSAGSGAGSRAAG